MKKFNSITLIITLLISISSLAQNKQEKVSLSFGGDVVFPFKAKSFHPGLGGTVKAAISITPKTSITLTSGYISFEGKIQEDGSWVAGEKFIPIRIGYQYRFNAGFYVEPQAGYARKMYGSFLAYTTPPADNTFNYAINLGYLITRNLDVSARFEDYILLGKKELPGKGTSQLPGIGLRVAYKFKLL